MSSQKSKIAVSSSTKLYLVRTKKIQEIAGCVLQTLGLFNCELSITFASPQTVKSLNRKYRGKDKTTDVLSFPQMEWKKPKLVVKTSRAKPGAGAMPLLLGDVVVSLSDAKKNAEGIGHGLDRETAFLITHGVLHLCGHDHMKAEEEELMNKQQRKIMTVLNNPKNSAQPLWKSCVSQRSRKMFR